MIDASRCSVCRSNLLETLRFPEYPLITSASATTTSIPLLPIVVGWCKHCTHVQLMQRPTAAQMDAIYLGEYTSVVKKGTFSGADRMALECRSFLDFASAGQLTPGGTVMEIGCFDGGFLSLFPGFKLLGCEPNPSGRDAAESIGIHVIPEYFSAAHFDPNSLDLIVMRHLIEHVPDPIALLQECKGLLTCNGMILIETPNIEHTLFNHVIGNFYHQHLHYFSIRSLPHLMRRSGYKIVAHGIKDFRQFMAIKPAETFVDTERDPYADSVLAALKEYSLYVEELQLQLQEWFRTHPDRIAIYGASSTATGIVHLGGIPLEKIAFVVDGDPRKIGVTIPGTNARVFSPDHLHEEPIDSVVIASDFYADEIEGLLRTHYGSVVKRVIRCHPAWKVVELGC